MMLTLGWFESTKKAACEVPTPVPIAGTLKVSRTPPLPCDSLSNSSVLPTSRENVTYYVALLI